MLSKSQKRIEFVVPLEKMYAEGKLSNPMKGLLLDLKNGNARLTEHAFTSTAKGAGVNTVKLFAQSEPKDLRYNNLVNGKPSNKQAMIVDRIVLTAKEITVAAGEEWQNRVADSKFSNISTIGGLQNGYLTLKSGANVYLDEYPLSAFTVGDQPNGFISGEIDITSFVLLEPETPIVAELSFGTNTPANVFFRLQLKGLCTIAS